MTVYRLRAKQRGPVCSYCADRAVLRGCGFTKFSCNSHEHWLRDDDRDQALRDSHQSEADWRIGY